MRLKKLLLFMFKAALSITLFMMIERFCHEKTDGFMLHKVQSNLSYDSRWEHDPLPIEEEKDILNRLDQPFFYLKSGGQCYAFISEDGTTILKLFKLHHMREVKWLSKFESLPEFMNPNRLRIFRYRQKHFQNIFGSCKIAYEEMREETGLLYSHLNKTNHLHKRVKIRDKLGIYHTLDLDKTEFLVQKKAVLVFEKFHQLKKLNDNQTAQKCIDSLIELFLTRYQKGIADKDPVIRKNFGFLGTQAIEIDLGSYSKNESLQNPSNYYTQLSAEMYDFGKWLDLNYPDLSPYLERKILSLTKENVR